MRIGGGGRSRRVVGGGGVEDVPVEVAVVAVDHVAAMWGGGYRHFYYRQVYCRHRVWGGTAVEAGIALLSSGGGIAFFSFSVSSSSSTHQTRND